MVIPLAVSTGLWIVLAVFVLAGVALVLAGYTRRGSGIDEHPIDGSETAPGSSGPTAFESSSEELPTNRGTR